MSTLIPLHVQMEIIKIVPVISLIRFRSVSKTWKSFIDSSHFITGYNIRLHSPHLLINYRLCKCNQINLVSFVDDDNFPLQKVTLTVPPLIQRLNEPTIIGSSHGLLCLYGYVKEPRVAKETGMVVVWNPAIRKSIAVSIGVHDWIQTVVGFGVCPKTSNPKLVKITNTNPEGTNSLQVEVFSLSLGEWRIPSCSSNLLPRKSIEIQWSQAVVGQFIYWLAIEMVDKNGGFGFRNTIMSFDLCTEEFKEVDLPDCLVSDISIFKLKESLAVLKYGTNEFEKRVCDVWMMEDADPKTFTKLFTIKPQDAEIRWVLGFRKNGEPIMEMEMEMEMADSNISSQVAVYETGSEKVNDLGIYGHAYSISLNNFYNESLLLLDHKDGYIAN